MGQPPDGLILLPVKVVMLPPLTMASGLTFSNSCYGFPQDADCLKGGEERDRSHS